MDSREKLNALVEKAKTMQPETEEQARLAQGVQLVVPMIAPMVPEDPAELDKLLLTLASWCVDTRSDGAAPRAELLLNGSAIASKPPVGEQLAAKVAEVGEGA